MASIVLDIERKDLILYKNSLMALLSYSLLGVPLGGAR
jgi:hypothetical protein